MSESEDGTGSPAAGGDGGPAAAAAGGDSLPPGVLHEVFELVFGENAGEGVEAGLDGLDNNYDEEDLENLENLLDEFEEESEEDEFEEEDDDGSEVSLDEAEEREEGDADDAAAEALPADDTTFTLSAQGVFYRQRANRFHEQVADSLSCQLARTSPTGEPLVAVAERSGGAAVIKLLLLGERSHMRFGELALNFRPYSLASSSCGGYLGSCGASGYFTLHRVKYIPEEGLSVSRLLTGVIVGRELPIMPGMQIPFAGANMNNSIRFGNIWGKERAIIACQVSNMFDDALGVGGNYAYIIDIPPEDQQGQHHACLPPESLAAQATKTAPCTSQYGDTEVGVTTKQVFMFQPRGSEPPIQQLQTAVLGPFPTEINCLVPSPDGKWIAVAADALELYLVRLGEGARAWCIEECATLSLRLPDDSVEEFQQQHHMRVEPGAQYVAWNSSSTMVAVSTDSTKRVFVWDVGRRTLVGGTHARCHPLPCLALCWSPFDPSLLFYAEQRARLHLQCVTANTTNEPHRGHQTITIPRERFTRRAVLGLAMCGSLEFPAALAATDSFIGRWPLIGMKWSPENHCRYPAKFKKATVALLMASLTDANGQPRHPNDGEFGLYSLPREVLLSVLGFAARPCTAWLTQ